MKYLILFVILFRLEVTVSQIQYRKVDRNDIFTENFFGIDFKKNIYHYNNNTLYKESSTKTYAYTDYSLGSLYSVDFNNPMKIVAFYKDYNTAVILDNRLNEIERIEFQANITFVKSGISNSLWIYNSDRKQIENYNYKTKSTSSNTQPLINHTIIDMQSNINTLSVLCKNSILTYDYLGNLIDQTLSNGAVKFQKTTKKLHLLIKGNLFSLEKEKQKTISIPFSIKIEKFFFSKDDLYIFDGTSINHFIIDKNY